MAVTVTSIGQSITLRSLASNNTITGQNGNAFSAVYAGANGAINLGTSSALQGQFERDQRRCHRPERDGTGNITSTSAPPAF